MSGPRGLGSQYRDQSYFFAIGVGEERVGIDGSRDP